MNGDLKMNSMAMVLQKIDFDRATLYYPKMMNWDRERDFDEVMGESLPAVIQTTINTDVFSLIIQSVLLVQEKYYFFFRLILR